MKNHLILILLFISISAYGQKYKIKKDVLLKDKVPVAKVEGKLGLLKDDLRFSTMDDKPVLNITSKNYSKVLPGNSWISWYTFSFPQLEKEMIIRVTSNYFGTKQFLKYEFHEKGLHFYEDGIHEEELEGLEDYGAQLQQDTLELISYFKFLNENLSGLHIGRPEKEEVRFGQFNGSYDLAIFQGKDKDGKWIVIGKIEYPYRTGMSSEDVYNRSEITIYKKLPRKVLFEGEETEYLPAGYIDLSDNNPELFLYEDGDEVSRIKFSVDEKKARVDSAKDAVHFMVVNGYL